MDFNNRKVILIFSGYNERAIFAFIRTIIKYDLNFYIIAKDENDNIFQTKYSKKVVYTRTNQNLLVNELKFICDEIMKEIGIHKIFLIAPSTEFINRFMLDNMDNLQKLNCFFPTINKELYCKISDKYSFGMMCKLHEIKIPKEYFNIKKEQIPFVAKPKKYISENGKIYSPILIKNERDLDNFFSEYNQNEFYYQQFIFGNSIYLLYYIYKDGTVLKCSQENLIQQEDGKSILLAKTSDYHNRNISKKFEDLFVKSHFNGLVMVELRVNNNEEYMIEANPRFWGPSQLFVDAGVNFFEAFLYDYGFLKEKPNINIVSNKYYFWDDGISQNYKERTNLAYHNFSQKNLISLMSQLKDIEIFNRNDTLNLYIGNKMKQMKLMRLKTMYEKTSKHSNYQILSEELRHLFCEDNFEIKSRNEKARLDYILKNINVKDKSILDIGGNTGYFTFELLSNGAKNVEYYEGNNEHASFVELASEVIEKKHQLVVHNKYFDFRKSKIFDIVLLLNVLHHIGDDFENNDISKEKALKKIIEYMNFMLRNTNILVFQLGFNWKGNVSLPFFENGTKKELIDFVTNGLEKKYKIIKIGIAVKENDTICYNDLNEINIKRDDTLGEFLNRPLFIIKNNEIDGKNNEKM